MEIIRHDGISSDLKKLKRFAAPADSLEQWERLFSAKGLQQMSGVKPFSGFGQLKIYKGRVLALRENLGKSGGYRVIFQLIKEGCYKILVFSRHGIYHDEKDLIDLIKSRLHDNRLAWFDINYIIC